MGEKKPTKDNLDAIMKGEWELGKQAMSVHYSYLFWERGELRRGRWTWSWQGHWQSSVGKKAMPVAVGCVVSGIEEVYTPLSRNLALSGKKEWHCPRWGGRVKGSFLRMGRLTYRYRMGGGIGEKTAFGEEREQWRFTECLLRNSDGRMIEK